MLDMDQLEGETWPRCRYCDAPVGSTEDGTMTNAADGSIHACPGLIRAQQQRAVVARDLMLPSIDPLASLDPNRTPINRVAGQDHVITLHVDSILFRRIQHEVATAGYTSIERWMLDLMRDELDGGIR